jgi:O-antigen/teichoic acid export membrane protein
MLVTIPAYFALSDMGFTAAATSDMTMAHAKGLREQVCTTFQSIWALVVSCSVGLIALSSPLLLPREAMSAHLSWWPHEGSALFFMMVYSGGALCSRVVLAGFRSTGNYALGTIIYDAIQFLEGLAVLLAAYLGYGFAVCAIAYMVVRYLNLLVCYLVLRRVTPWMLLGFEKARKTEVKRLLKPALSALAIPTALALNLQGMVLIAGTVIGPVAAAMLGPVRTASRITIQLIGIINRATMPEFSSAVATGDKASLNRLLAINLRSVFFVLLPGAFLFGWFGDSLVGYWSGGKIRPDAVFVGLVAVSMFFHGLWFFASNLLVSINRHGRFGKLLLPVSIFAVGVTFPLSMNFGLLGLAIGIICSELLAVVLLVPDVRANFLSKSVA